MRPGLDRSRNRRLDLVCEQSPLEERLEVGVDRGRANRRNGALEHAVRKPQTPHFPLHPLERRPVLAHGFLEVRAPLPGHGALLRLPQALAGLDESPDLGRLVAGQAVDGRSRCRRLRELRDSGRELGALLPQLLRPRVPRLGVLVRRQAVELGRLAGHSLFDPVSFGTPGILPRRAVTAIVFRPVTARDFQSAA